MVEGIAGAAQGFMHKRLFFTLRPHSGQNLSLIASGAFLKCIESIDAHTRCIDVAVAHESPQISSGSLTEAILTEVQKPFRHLNRSRIGTSHADPVGV